MGIRQKTRLDSKTMKMKNALKEATKDILNSNKKVV